MIADKILVLVKVMERVKDIKGMKMVVVEAVMVVAAEVVVMSHFTRF